MEKVQKGNIAGLQADTWLGSEKAAVALGKKGYKAVLQVKTGHGLFQKKFIEETQRSPWWCLDCT
jgi:hypothetical protein